LCAKVLFERQLKIGCVSLEKKSGADFHLASGWHFGLILNLSERVFST